jgi:hypothetical protein
MRALRAGRVVNDLGAAVRWTALTTGVANVRAFGKTRIPRNDGSIGVSVLNENESANVEETAMETENGTGSTGSASETLNGTGNDATVSGNGTGNETATETETETANEVIGTDGTKKIVIERARRIATLAVERCCRPTSLPDQVIVPLPLPRKR